MRIILTFWALGILLYWIKSRDTKKHAEILSPTIRDLLENEWFTISDLHSALEKKEFYLSLSDFILVLDRLRSEGVICIYDRTNTWEASKEFITGAHWVRLPYNP